MIKICDMRAKEILKVGDQVQVIGREVNGRIVAFDPDQRLARVDTGIGLGWWYLKDLVKI